MNSVERDVKIIELENHPHQEIPRDNVPRSGEISRSEYLTVPGVYMLDAIFIYYPVTIGPT